MSMGVDLDFGGDAGAPPGFGGDDGDGPAVAAPVAAAVVPGFDDLFAVLGVQHPPAAPGGTGLFVPYQLGRGTFGAVFLCQLREGAAARIAGLPDDIMTRASREHLTIPGMLFACKFVVLPEAEASDMYDKEVRAAMEFDRRIAATGWAHLARATLTSTIYGWMDTPLEPATGLQVMMPYPRSVDAPVPVRLIRTVMELNFSSVPPGGPAALPPFKGVPPMRRFAFRDAATGLLNAIDLPNVRRATDEELAGTA